MAMDDTYALAAAIVTNKPIQLKIKKKKTLIANVICATISCDHKTGSFYGSVNYLIEGEKYVKIEAFYNMWLQGWQPAGKQPHYLDDDY
jgi:hypothetical protein